MKKTFLVATSVAIFLVSSFANAEEAKNQNPGAAQNKKSLRAEIEQNPSCVKILDECKKLGFVSGGLIRGKGLWKGCFQAVIEEKPVTLSGKEVVVNADPEDVSICRDLVKKNKE